MRVRPLLFVYGTLRPGSGHRNARRLADEATWLGPAVASGMLWCVSTFPGFAPGPHGLVTGDVMRLRDAASLDWLDRYEMCGPDDPLPHPYRRIDTVVTCRGRPLRVATYAWVAPIRGLRPVPDGDWLSRRRQ